MHVRGTNHSMLAAILLGLSLTYWLAIFIATHLPLGPALPGSPRGLDKLVHGAAFAGLAIVLSATGAIWLRSSGRLYAAVFGVAAVYGAFDELTQMLVPRRTADFRDWAADLFGAALGIAVFAVSRHLVQRK